MTTTPGRKARLRNKFRSSEDLSRNRPDIRTSPLRSCRLGIRFSSHTPAWFQMKASLRKEGELRED